MARLDSIKFGTLKRIISSIGARSHGYEVHKKTGLSLATIYTILPILVAEGILAETEYDKIERRKYVYLTDKGKKFAEICSSIDNEISTRIPFLLVVFDLDGVIFERPWEDLSDDMVSVSTWDLLFKRLNAYDEHEKLKADFKSGKFGSYNEWTARACQVLRDKGLTRTIFEEVINLRKYNHSPLAVKDTILTLWSRGISVGVVTGSFHELAQKMSEELGLQDKVSIEAHCRLEFDEQGSLKSWRIMPTDYKDKATLLEFFLKEIPLKSIAYIGDDVNDLAVFRKVGMSIAFNASKEQVRRAAKVVIEGNDLRKVLPYLMAQKETVYTQQSAKITHH